MKDSEFYSLLDIIVSVKNHIMDPDPMASDQWAARSELVCLFEELARLHYGSYEKVNEKVRTDIYRKIGFSPDTGYDLEFRQARLN